MDPTSSSSFGSSAWGSCSLVNITHMHGTRGESQWSYFTNFQQCLFYLLDESSLDFVGLSICIIFVIYAPQVCSCCDKLAQYHWWGIFQILTQKEGGLPCALHLEAWLSSGADSPLVNNLALDPLFTASLSKTRECLQIPSNAASKLNTLRFSNEASDYVVTNRNTLGSRSLSAPGIRGFLTNSASVSLFNHEVLFITSVRWADSNDLIRCWRFPVWPLMKSLHTFNSHTSSVKKIPVAEMFFLYTLYCLFF